MGLRNAIVVITLAFPGALGLPGQDDAKAVVPDAPDPKVEDTAALVAECWKDRRMQRDAEVVRGLRELKERAAKPLHPDDRRAMLEVGILVLTKGKLREPKDRQPYEAAAELLAQFGGDGATVLNKVYERKVFPRKPEWEPMRAALVTAIGSTKVDGVVEFLLEIVTRSGENQVLKAAGKALGDFTDAKGEVRKEIVEKLSSRMSGFETLAAQNAVNAEANLNFVAEAAKKTVTAIRDTWIGAMARLTGKSFDTGVEWEKWFRDHRREPWPDGEKR